MAAGAASLTKIASNISSALSPLAASSPESELTTSTAGFWSCSTDTCQPTCEKEITRARGCNRGAKIRARAYYLANVAGAVPALIRRMSHPASVCFDGFCDQLVQIPDHSAIVTFLLGGRSGEIQYDLHGRL